MKPTTHSDIKRIVASSKGMVVEDMIQEESVNILVGDSGLGKSPLLMQLALCVASGLPFLDLRTRSGPVLCLDYENSLMDLDVIIDTLNIHLGLSTAPDNLFFLHYPDSISSITTAIKDTHPILVIIDALRGFDPNAEKDNTNAAQFLTRLHKLAEANHCAFLILHHPRKTDQKEPPPKLSAPTSSVMDWLQQASGARSLVNQTDARFGIEAHNVGEADLLMRGHFKLRGEVGPWPITRVLDEEGEALGYRRVTGIGLLSQMEKSHYIKLPSTFTWKEAETILFPGKKGGKALSQLLKRSQAAGILYKTGDKRSVIYHKHAPKPDTAPSPTCN